MPGVQDDLKKALPLVRKDGPTLEEPLEKIRRALCETHLLTRHADVKIIVKLLTDVLHQVHCVVEALKFFFPFFPNRICGRRRPPYSSENMVLPSCGRRDHLVIVPHLLVAP